MPALRGEPLEAPGIAAEDQKDRRRTDPRHARDEGRQPLPTVRIGDPDDRNLLKIRFRRGRERRRQQQLQQRLRDRTVGIAPMGAPQQHPAQKRKFRQLTCERRPFPEAGDEFGIVILGHKVGFR
jgi:hypothetical protein